MCCTGRRKFGVFLLSLKVLLFLFGFFSPLPPYPHFPQALQVERGQWRVRPTRGTKPWQFMAMLAKKANSGVREINCAWCASLQKRQTSLLRVGHKIPVSAFRECTMSGISYVSPFSIEVPHCRPWEVHLCSCCLCGMCRSHLLYRRGRAERLCWKGRVVGGRPALFLWAPSCPTWWGLGVTWLAEGGVVFCRSQVLSDMRIAQNFSTLKM